MSVLDELKQKFTSGNSVPVERATITLDEFERLTKERDELAANNARLREALASAVAGIEWYRTTPDFNKCDEEFLHYAKTVLAETRWQRR